MLFCKCFSFWVLSILMYLVMDFGDVGVIVILIKVNRVVYLVMVFLMVICILWWIFMRMFWMMFLCLFMRLVIWCIVIFWLSINFLRCMIMLFLLLRWWVFLMNSCFLSIFWKRLVMINIGYIWLIMKLMIFVVWLFVRLCLLSLRCWCMRWWKWVSYWWLRFLR